MKKYIFICISVLVLMSCNDLLNTEPEINVNVDNFWQNEGDVESFSNNLHILFRNCYSNIPWIFGETRARSTDAMTNWLWKDFFDNDLTSPYGQLNWSAYFKVVASCNMLLENVHRAGLKSEREKYYVGMAKFMRAFSYFAMSRIWGEVPLMLKSTDVEAKAKAEINEIMAVIIADAEEARILLPQFSELTWADGTSVTTKQIPSKGAADALLAHVYAWFGSLNNDEEMLQKGIEACTRLMENTEYELAGTIADLCENVMYGNSSEGIFEIEARSNSADQLGSTALIAGLTAGYPVIPKKMPGDITHWSLQNVIMVESVKALYNDVNDDRRKEYFYELDEMAELPESNGRAYLYKWRHIVLTTDGNDDFLTFEDNIILYRLADIILLRAELFNRLGNVEEAIVDLNVIRNRANAQYYSAEEGDLKEVILQERYKELYLENHRFFDLVRNDELRNKVETFSEITDQEVEEGAYYWPVSSSNFVKNPHMRQNAYWKKQGL